MYLIHLRPSQLKKAVENNIPLIMAAGCVEYHGPHLPIGTDYLIAESIVKRVEKLIPENCVVALPLPFSPTMNWAGSVEEGDVDFSPEVLYMYAREIFSQMVKMGFKRIYILQHHQGAEGLPSLCLKKAASEVTRDVVKQWGHSWGKKEIKELPNHNIFNLIQIAHADSYIDYAKTTGPMPIGHGGKGETQLIMTEYPQTVDLDALDIRDAPEWLSDAHEANANEGQKWLDLCAEGWARELLMQPTQ
ncbi:MAG: creatininase family protein [Defluviitaleaceae bacterium]|nr:creatininase family protein [Defluviitaleaceae bacterium]